MKVTAKELATVLAALRYWQANYDDEVHDFFAEYFSDVTPLTGVEIDKLCEELNNEQEQDEFFVITRLHREDVIAAGYDGDSLSDSDMEYIADKMGDDYINQLYHSSLRIMLEDADVPKLPVAEARIS